MKKNILLFVFSFLSFINFLAGKDKFPIEGISAELNNSKALKIIVFMPSITEETEYASMLTQAFQNYFIQKLAFDAEDRNKVSIDIILVSNQDSIQNNTHLLFGGSLITTEGMKVFNRINKPLKEELDLPSLEDLNSDSVLFLLDSENNIILRDNEYRGQGEHLKPLEHKIKETLKLPYPKVIVENRTIKVGDIVSKDILDKIKKQSRDSLKEDIKVLTFYPAAYSGMFESSLMRRNRMAMMSCAVHIRSFDELPVLSNKVSYYSVSESTPEILNNWKNALETYHIEYLNDPDYSISNYFGAYNHKGYNNRVSVIIDADGKIAYIDTDYKFEKKEEIAKVIEKLSEDKKKK